MVETFSMIEGQVLLFLQNFIRNPFLNPILIGLTHAGMIIWPILGVALLISKKHRKEGLGLLLAIAIGALITNVLLKNVIARPRPYTLIDGLTILIKAPRDYSFPSGHTCMSVASAGAMIGLSNRKWAVAACILAVVVAFSRMYVGVHYPTDILGGALIGAFSAWLSVHIVESRTTSKGQK